MNFTKILSIVLFLLSLVLAGLLYRDINGTIEFKETVRVTEDKIKDKLAVIREAEKVYLERYGKYTSNWDSLIDFIENGKVPITVRSEKITQLSYGEEKVEVFIDTIGIMSAKDKIFKKSFTLNATNTGTFGGYLVKEGDYVAKTRNAYRLKADNSTKGFENYKFIESGHITALADINSGDKVTKNQVIANLWEYHLNPNVDINTLAEVPGLEGKTFDIFVGTVKRGNAQVSVIEVKDPSPINPERRATNEAKNRQPLGFGSRVDVSTSGNWE